MNQIFLLTVNRFSYNVQHARYGSKRPKKFQLKVCRSIYRVSSLVYERLFNFIRILDIILSLELPYHLLPFPIQEKILKLVQTMSSVSTENVSQFTQVSLHFQDYQIQSFFEIRKVWISKLSRILFVKNRIYGFKGIENLFINNI